MKKKLKVSRTLAEAFSRQGVTRDHAAQFLSRLILRGTPNLMTMKAVDTFLKYTEASHIQHTIKGGISHTLDTKVKFLDDEDREARLKSLEDRAALRLSRRKIIDVLALDESTKTS